MMNAKQIREAQYQVQFPCDGGEIRVNGSAEVGVKHLHNDKPGHFTAASNEPFTVEVWQRAVGTISKHEGVKVR